MWKYYQNRFSAFPNLSTSWQVTIKRRNWKSEIKNKSRIRKRSFAEHGGHKHVPHWQVCRCHLILPGTLHLIQVGEVFHLVGWAGGASPLPRHPLLHPCHSSLFSWISCLSVKFDKSQIAQWGWFAGRNTWWRMIPSRGEWRGSLNGWWREGRLSPT